MSSTYVPYTCRYTVSDTIDTFYDRESEAGWSTGVSLDTHESNGMMSVWTQILKMLDDRLKMPPLRRAPCDARGTSSSDSLDDARD